MTMIQGGQMGPRGGAAAVGLSAPPWPSLYVGDLDPSVTEAHLLHAFASFGPILSPRLCRHCATGASLRYAYLNFLSHSHAEYALKAMNHTRLNGRPIRIMWSHRNPHPRKTGVGNLFVKNLDAWVNGAVLERMFSEYGVVMSCKVATDEYGNSKRFGFVQMDSEAAAISAIEALQGKTYCSGTKKLYVSKFIKRSERKVQTEETKCTNLYIKNLDGDITKEILCDKFSRFGKVKSAVVMQDELGKSKGFGFVSFELPEHAMKTMEAMNGSQLGSRILYVGRAQKKAERVEMLKQQFEARRGLTTVYVKNLDASVDGRKLREYFSACGKIVFAKVVRLANGLSRGFGFVSFSSPEEANLAIEILNGTMLCGKHLYVAMALRKEYRPNAMTNSLPASHSTFQGYPSGSLCSYPYDKVTSDFQMNYPLCPVYPLPAINYLQPISYGHYQNCYWYFGPSTSNSKAGLEEAARFSKSCSSTRGMEENTGGLVVSY